MSAVRRLRQTGLLMDNSRMFPALVGAGRSLLTIQEAAAVDVRSSRLKLAPSWQI
jgi:hypothetical protein